MMLEYYNDQSGWWHELLHKLVHGKTSGAGIFFKPVLFAEWKVWFEHQDHKDALKGPDVRARLGHGYRVDDQKPTASRIGGLCFREVDVKIQVPPPLY